MSSGEVLVRIGRCWAWPGSVRLAVGLAGIGLVWSGPALKAKLEAETSTRVALFRRRV